MAALYLLPNKLGRPPLSQLSAKGKERRLGVEEGGWQGCGAAEPRFAQDCPSMTVHSHPSPLARREGLGALRGSGREEGTLRTGLSILAPLPPTPSVPQHCKAMPGKAGLETLAPEPVMGEQKQILLSQPPLPTAPLSPISSH